MPSMTSKYKVLLSDLSWRCLVICGLSLATARVDADISSLLPKTAKTTTRGMTVEHTWSVDGVVHMISLLKFPAKFAPEKDVENASLAAAKFGKGINAQPKRVKSLQLEEGRFGSVYTFKKGNTHFVCLFAFDQNVAQVLALVDVDEDRLRGHADQLFMDFRRLRSKSQNR